jgi:hypothetical protein
MKAKKLQVFRKILQVKKILITKNNKINLILIDLFKLVLIKNLLFYQYVFLYLFIFIFRDLNLKKSKLKKN